MKIKKYFLLGFILFLGFNNCFSQSSIYVQGMNFVGEFTVNSNSRNSIPFTKGSPYYNRDFMFGELELQNGGKLKGLFRYNIYNQEFEVIVKRDTLIISEPTKVKTIDFANKSFVYSLIHEKKGNTSYLAGAYFETLNKGNCKLLIKRKINLRENKYVDYYGGGGGDGSQRYIPEETYYIKLSDDKPAIKLKRKKDFVLELFSDHKVEIEKFISENKIKLKKDQDFLKVIEYYNQLN
ncbi:MAG: hypothetical protein A2041_12005 [Bacteroidetes bacterium GWA2_31_9b]|nr:MAG: hypothetical protein A2041_12005 [Bacteroidetes bacterium GWA2_31_9b]